MVQSSKSKTIIIFILIALAILSCNYIVMTTDIVGPIDDLMIIASLIDLTIVLPLFFYILVVRNRFSIITLLPVVIGGFWFSYFIVPHHELAVFSYVKYSIYALEAIFIAIELALGIILLRKIPTLIRNYKKRKELDFFFSTTLRNAFRETFGQKKFADILVFDFSIFYYGLFVWKKKWQPNENVGEVFSFHTKSGYFGIFIMLVHAMVIEVIGVHFLIAQWSTTAAWIFTAFDVYALLWIIADYHAVRLSPIVLSNGRLYAQVGVRRGIEVNLDNIKSVSSTITDKKSRNREKNSFAITLPDFFEEDPQFEIELKEPTIAILPFGKQKEITKLYVTVDEKDKFQHMLNSVTEVN
ncbi:hypothetical protein [Fredinandcohnia sp. 179-A 10B2 NHS]|uniref:hypothetical protein n=1 Tax=Fredinandcohnia sp. 179-A 10B2 NHS TaxID=3235176 RepID=UPI0039A150CF